VKVEIVNSVRFSKMVQSLACVQVISYHVSFEVLPIGGSGVQHQTPYTDTDVNARVISSLIKATMAIFYSKVSSILSNQRRM